MPAWTRLADNPQTSVRGVFIGAVEPFIYTSGGYTETSYIANTSAYDINAGTWTAKAASPNSSGFGPCGGANGNFYQLGGHYSGNFKYVPGTNSWSAVAATQAGEHGAYVVENSQYIYSIAGNTVQTVLKYDAVSNTWTTLANYPEAALGPTAGLCGNMIYAAGGYVSGVLVKLTYAYDKTANTWTAKADMPASRYLGAGVGSGNKFYFVAGNDGATAKEIGTTFVYDGSTNSWSTDAYNVNVTRWDISVTTSGTKAYISNGRYASGNNGAFEVAQFNIDPNTPIHQNISNQGNTLNKRPKFFFQVSDPDAGNTLTNIQVQISTDSTFAATSVNNQYGSDSGYGTTGGTWTGEPTASNAASTVTFIPPVDLPVGALYIRARAKDNNGAWSTWATTQLFTVATASWADVIPDDAYGFKAAWLNDLATSINAARQFRGLATFGFTDGAVTAGTTDMKAAHITERRTKVTDVLTIVGVVPAWTDAPGTAVDRKGKHVNELRNYCLQT